MEGQLTLAQTVTLLLCERGAEGLADCRMILSYAMDYMDKDAVGLRVLVRNCDDQLLAPYAQAAKSSDPDLSVASRRAIAYLTNECMVDEAAARLVADGIAEGVERWLSSDDKPDDDGGVTGESKDRRVSWVRNSDVVGLFVDSMERVHISVLWNGEGAHARKLRFSDAVTDMAGARECCGSLLGRTRGKRIDAVVSTSELTLRNFLRMSASLRDAGINVVRWCLPTDALAYSCRPGSLPSARLRGLTWVTARNGVTRCLRFVRPRWLRKNGSHGAMDRCCAFVPWTRLATKKASRVPSCTPSSTAALPSSPCPPAPSLRPEGLPCVAVRLA